MATESTHVSQVFTPRPQPGPLRLVLGAALLAVGLFITCQFLPGALPIEEGPDDSHSYDPPVGYELNIYRVLRQPHTRPVAIQNPLKKREAARRDIMALAQGTRFGEDR